MHAEDDLDDLLVRLADAGPEARRLRMTPTTPDPILDD
jgi:hypothetical protein